MSYLLFVDESGQDRRESPYEVLAGICLEDRDLWSFICQVQDAETHHFGQRVTTGLLELKGKELLKKKTFKLADQMPPFPPEERTRLARDCLIKGAAAQGKTTNSGVTRAELTALGQAKIAFVERILELCTQYRVRVFGSVVDRDAPRPQGDFLRKDYAYLFERFYHFLEDQSTQQLGLVIFDELERSQCHILVDQMSRYFRETAKGRMRAGRIIPEPFFVHSDLTTAIQVADVMAYLLAWGVRIGGMTRERREELAPLAELVRQLRWTAPTADGEHRHWSIAIINDLRPRDERNEANGQ
jgi:hypothetical protein